MMKDTLIYKINYSETPFNIRRIGELLKSWLDKNKLDILVNDLELLNESSIILDYHFNPSIDTTAIKALTEQFFTRLNIDYELEEQRNEQYK